MEYLLEKKKEIEEKLAHPEKWMPWQITILETDLDTINKELEKLK